MTVRNVVFDLGNVLVRCDVRYAAERLGSHQCTADNIEKVLLNTDIFDRFDLGSISEAEFYQEIRDLARWSGTIAELRSIWQEMLSVDERMVGLVKRLRDLGINLFVLSNANPMHKDHVEGSFLFIREMHGVVYSCDCRLIKPDPKIFEHLLAKFKLKALETIFIDDKLVNIEAANQLGITGILHTSYETTLAKLDQFVPELLVEA